jgi:hypothetical protein
MSYFKIFNKTDDISEDFLKTAVIFVLTVGCTWGAFVLLGYGFENQLGGINRAFVEAHGHSQILGWTGLFIIGIAYVIIPRFRATTIHSPRAANLSYFTFVPGIIIRWVAQILLVDPNSAWNPLARTLMLISIPLEIVGFGLFTFVIIRTLFSTDKPHGVFEWYVLTGILWLYLQIILGGIIGYNLAADNVSQIPPETNRVYLHLAIMAIAMVIMGVSARTLPVFLGKKEVNPRFMKGVLALLNGGLMLRLVGDAALEINTFNAALVVGTVLEALAVFLFIWGLNIFHKAEVDFTGLELDRSYEKFLYVAYFWLGVAFLMDLLIGYYEGIQASNIGVAFFPSGGEQAYQMAHAFVGAYRHAITVGFFSMMILGYAMRIIPVFKGVKLYSNTLVNVSFWLINIGNIMRVFFQPVAAYTNNSFIWTFMSISGAIEVLALLLFGINIWKTINQPYD